MTNQEKNEAHVRHDDPIVYMHECHECNAMVQRYQEREKNEAVARKLGWTFCEHAGAMGAVRPNPIKPHFHEAIPDYCGKIEAAWGIVPKLGKFKLEYDPDQNVWELTVIEWDDGDDEVTAEAPTAPMAIVDAFLKVP